MRAEDLKIEELIDFSEGRIGLKGRRLVLHSINAFARFRKDLIDTVGLTRARAILTRFGFFWGEADAAAMERIFSWDAIEELLAAGPRLHSLQGVARNRIKALHVDTEAGKLRCELEWHDSGEAEEHLIEVGPSDQAVCWMLAGYASGYFTYCFGRRIYFVEQKCRAKGDRLCTALGMDEGSWGMDLDETRASFEVDDVTAQIRELTRELTEKNREIAAQRKLILALEPTGAVLPEVRSRIFKGLLELCARVAPYDSTVLILGETGAGKEVLARHIHSLSKRSNEPFVAVNCGALPETLLESELFGHKAGAFTGANEDRVGLFEHANKGTLFLDEIGDVSLATQVKLLRMLQTHEITRVGESSVRHIDVRIIAATNRNLEEALADGTFREDLYYRLGVIRIEVPPLRKRQEDILPLARYFVERVAARLGLGSLKLDADCLDELLGYPWPGNVRELENAIERAAVMSEGGIIRSRDLPPTLRSRLPGSAGKGAVQRLADVERAHVLAVLESSGGSRAKAAEALGISTTTLWRKLKAWKE